MRRVAGNRGRGEAAAIQTGHKGTDAWNEWTGIKREDRKAPSPTPPTAPQVFHFYFVVKFNEHCTNPVEQKRTPKLNRNSVNDSAHRICVSVYLCQQPITTEKCRTFSLKSMMQLEQNLSPVVIVSIVSTPVHSRNRFLLLALVTGCSMCFDTYVHALFYMSDLFFVCRQTASRISSPLWCIGMPNFRTPGGSNSVNIALLFSCFSRCIASPIRSVQKSVVLVAH